VVGLAREMHRCSACAARSAEAPLLHYVLNKGLCSEPVICVAWARRGGLQRFTARRVGGGVEGCWQACVFCILQSFGQRWCAHCQHDSCIAQTASAHREDIGMG
jgi:hypothetical protein